MRQEIITLAPDAGARADAIEFARSAAAEERFTSSASFGLLKIAATCIDIDERDMAKQLLDEVAEHRAPEYAVEVALQRYRLGRECA
jgi:predicted negative regulator of RcsB-dependent stress response